MIVSHEDLASIRVENSQDTIVLVHGVYDILHQGHIKHLEVAKAIADKVMVGIWSDEQVARRKGSDRPYSSLSDRLFIMDAFRSVDWVFGVPGEDTSDSAMLPHINSLEPDIYLLSSGKQLPFGDRQYIEHPSGRLTGLQYDISYRHKASSTTQILARIHRETAA